MATAMTWSAPKSWSDLGHHLQTIQERIRYARSANDKQLAKEVAAQLQSCAYSWRSQLQQCLDGEATTAPSELLADGADAAVLEMCLAQIETMLTNLDLLDWSATSDVVLKQLERETNALDKLRPRRSLETDREAKNQEHVRILQPTVA